MGAFMRIFLLILAPLALSGCTLFESQQTAALRAPSAPVAGLSSSSTREAFRPAYGPGQPVALIPCRSGEAMGGECSRGLPAHRYGGDAMDDEASGPLVEVSVGNSN